QFELRQGPGRVDAAAAALPLGRHPQLLPPVGQPVAVRDRRDDRRRGHDRGEPHPVEPGRAARLEAGHALAPRVHDVGRVRPGVGKGSAEPRLDVLVQDHVTIALAVVTSVLPVFLFLGALVLIDSYKLVPLRAILLSVAAGVVAAGAAWAVNVRLPVALGMDFDAYSQYVAPLI